MADDLETELRRAARNGLNWVSFHKEWKGPGWTATFRNAGPSGYSEHSDPDPVKALLGALRAATKVVKGSNPAPAPEVIEPTRRRRNAEEDLL